MCQKLAPNPFLILLNNPKQPLHARKSFRNKTFWKRIIKKPQKKLTLFFLLNPVPFNGQSYQIQKGSGTSHQSLLRSWNKFRKISLFVIILSDQDWWCNVKQFLNYSKNYISKFTQVSSWHHKLFHFHLSFWIRKVWKGKKLQKFEYLENKRSFLDEIKNIFHSF